MDMKTFCLNQIEEIKKHKWILGEKLGYDPGEKAVEDWIKNHAKSYRENHKKCINLLISKVHEQIKNNDNIKKLDLSDEQLISLEKIIIEQFTLVWIKENIINEKELHLKEV